MYDKLQKQLQQEPDLIITSSEDDSARWLQQPALTTASLAANVPTIAHFARANKYRTH